MKKLLAFSLALTFGLSLCACGSETDSSGAASAADSAAQTTAAPETTEAETSTETTRVQDSDTIEIGTAQELLDFAKRVTDGSIGGLCGYSGTHSVGSIALETEGVETHEYPGIIKNCTVTVKMNVPGATHVGGLIGTGLYYYGEETAFKVVNCSVNGEIVGAVTPGAAAGRAEHSIIESCNANVTLDGKALTDEIGKTDRMYESSDQGSEEESEEPAEEKPAA